MSSSDLTAAAVFEREINAIAVRIAELNRLEPKTYLEETMIQDEVLSLLKVRSYMKDRLAVFSN